MPLKAVVKVGGLTNLSDVRYCAGMGVDLIGFSVIPGEPAYIEPTKFQEIRGWVTGPSVVAELQGLSDPTQISRIAEEYKPDYFEIRTSQLPFINELKTPFILYLVEGEEMPVLATDPAFVICSTPINTSIDVPILVQARTPEAAMLALEYKNVVGVSMTGSSEIKPGLKSYDELAAILERLEED